MANKSTIFEHLVELRARLVKSLIFFFAAFIISYYFAEEIYSFLVKPLAEAVGDNERRMIYTGLTEAFFTYVKLALFAAFFFSFPLIGGQLYLFLAPGLYKKERKLLLPILLAAPILFFLGGAVVYYFIMPLAWEFFLSFESLGGNSLPIQMEAKVSEYLSLVMHLIIGFGLAFQLPIILMLLVKSGAISIDYLKKQRRIAIVIIVIAAAILTPPDIISQIGLAVILYALYELSIIGARFLTKNA
ncbi:MAG: twin-arginine translocase subunit TatC [Alphaproteobacteria bacterium CG11_big_fil_rev_8_21_14_0_20_44_7]|nr:MAG: twin-arginine translocase subunit TatC [Alphaproteobacteria bacterium CG11_big_fil_rev_8_21_14_0_20_44_7]